MGGPSCERDISLKSGRAVLQALLNRGIEAVAVELPTAPLMNGYKEAVIDRLHSSDLDAVFITLHGEFGEDGGIQEILEGMGMPYTGSRVYASRLSMDKIGSREIFRSKDIATPRHRTVIRGSILGPPQGYFEELGSPLVIKPSDRGSSIGLSIIDSERNFYTAIHLAFKYSDKVMIEEYIKGREVTVGILGDEALPIVEIVPKKGFFDFEAKYEKGLTEYIIPAGIDKEIRKLCHGIALLSHKALGVRFFSRVDMILSEKDVPVVLELNTIPGLTETSLLPKAALAAGIGFEDLVLKILGSVNHKGGA